MKFKFFRTVLGMVMVVSMIMCSSAAIAVENEETNNVALGGDTITLELKNYVSDEVNADSGFKIAGGCAQILADPTKEDDYRNFTVNFETKAAGYYSLDIIAACYGYVPWLSNVNYSLNGAASVDLYTNENNRLMQKLDTEGTFQRGRFSIKESVYLTEGTNVLTFSCKERSSDKLKIAAALEKAVFTPKNVIPSNGVIELENYAVDNNIETMSQATASNSQITKTGNANISEEEFTIKVNVPEAARYSLGVAAGCKFNLTWLSPLSVSINGGTYESLENYVKTEYSHDTSTFGTALFTRADVINLNAGENTITLKATPRDDGGIYYSLDYISLNKLGVIKPLPENGKIEAEDYATEWEAEMTTQSTASNGAVITKKLADQTEDEVSMTVSTAEEGDYVIAVGAGCSAWAEWLSPLAISFNDGEYENLSDYGVSGVIADSDDGFRCARMTRQQAVHLSAGTNTIKFKASARTAGGVYYSIDYIDIVRVQNAESISVIPDTGRIEAEDYAEQIGMTVNTLDVASGGASAVVKNASASSDVVSIAFISDEKKQVILSVGAASQAWAPWLSPVHVQINGGKKEDLLSFNKTSTQEGEDGFRNADMVRRGNIEINKGLNVITFYAEPRTADFNGGIYYGIDYIDMAKANTELQEPEMSLQTELEVDDKVTITIMDGSAFITPADVYQLTYKSSNEAVATVDGNGLVTAVSSGTTEITVAIRANKNSDEIVLKKIITVSGEEENMVSIDNIVNNDGTVSFDVKNSIDLDKAEIYIASYDSDGILVSIKKHNVENIAANTGYKVSEILENYDESQRVRIYMWMGMYPVIDSIDVK